jgi:hypothetical protein
MIILIFITCVFLISYLLYKNKEHFTQKKKIVFLFSGNARTFPFNIISEKRSKNILESYNQFIFTENFKEKYDYDVYITTDDIHLENTIEYFSENHIKNIHLLDTNYYLKTKSNTKEVEYYLNKYNEKDWTNFDKHEGSIHQHYKILDCYNLAKENGSLENVDYIVRIRMDTVIKKDIQEIISMIESSSEIEIVIDSDLFALGKPSIMEWYCNGLNNNYGNYNFEVPVPDTFPVMETYLTNDKKRWTYAAERQLFEMLYDYCHKNNLDINKAIKNTGTCVIER